MRSRSAASKTEEDSARTHCGALALLGPPNVGKSSLINALAGTHLAGVTRKAQTTRQRQLVLLAEGRTQLILLDAPGYLAPPRRLQRALMEEAKAAYAQADILCFVLDVALPLAHNERMLEGLLAQFPPEAKPAFLALNKLDKTAPPAVLAHLDALQKAHGFQALVPVSARRGTGVAKLRGLLAAACPRGRWRYEADMQTDWSDCARACDITRLHLLRRLHAELPYGLSVEPQDWTQKKDALTIAQTICVPAARQRAIVLGRGGETIKAIASAARREMEKRFGQKVHLFVRVQLARAARSKAKGGA